MRLSAVTAVAIGTLLIGLSAPFLPARTQEDTPGPLRLDLGFGQSPPGSSVTIPLTLSLSGSIWVGEVVSEIFFPTRLLSFQEARTGLAAQIGKAELSVRAGQDPGDPERSSLTVVLKTGVETGLPEGVLADLTFVISEEPSVGDEIILENRVSAVSAGDEGSQIGSRGRDGQILIDQAPEIFACFFYMH